MKKVICINTFSGRNIYIETTEEKWKELTKDVEVFHDRTVIGWHMDQDKIGRVAHGEYPEREDFKCVAITPWKDMYEAIGVPFVPVPPTVDYYITFSSFDKPENS